MKSIYILSKDLRLNENQTLVKACESSELAFVYLYPKGFESIGEARKSFLIESLESLKEDLKEKNYTLYLLKEISELKSINTDRILISKEFNSRDQLVFNKIKKLAEDRKVEFLEIENSLLYSLESLPFSVDDLPKGFTSFRKKIEKKNVRFNHVDKEITRWPKPLNLDLEKCETIFSGDFNRNKDFQGGEKKALERLHDYLWEKERAKTYKDTRNGMIDFDDSTKFSPWLSLGCISPITIMEELGEFEEKIERNESTYWIYFELMWREFFRLYSLKFGDKIFSLNGLGLKSFKIKNPKDQEADFAQWVNGETKEPFVNANMIELSKTGWMSNRGRQNVASYLSKHLCVDWRWGAEHFETHLIDYDVESNWGNWNYNAGVGVDPRDRTFNIKRQADMYDPDGEYQKLWLK